MKKFVAFTALALFATAPALAESGSFSKDGENYRYSRVEKNGVAKIHGANITTGAQFVLRVRDNQVRGTYNGQPVSFRLKETVATEIAAR